MFEPKQLSPVSNVPVNYFNGIKSTDKEKCKYHTEDHPPVFQKINSQYIDLQKSFYCLPKNKRIKKGKRLTSFESHSK